MRANSSGPRSNKGKPRKKRGAFALPTFSPWKLSITIAAIYLVLGITYIVLSGYLAAHFAESVAHLKYLEQIKGVGFIIVTAVLLLVFGYPLFRRIAHEERVCAHQREALILSENRALAGMFAASVAHDINNVLTVLDYAIEQLSKEKSADPAHPKRIEQLKESNERLKELTKRLGQSTSPEPPDVFERMDLIETIEKTVDLARTHIRVRSCDLSLGAEDTFTMIGNPVLIHQMVMNLIINAADACQHQGRIEVTARREGGHCVVEVHDDGPGIPEKEREMIFTPFYTTKHQGKGLGLLSVKACADAHHGRVEVVDSPLGGACFRIGLPIDVNIPTATST